MRPDPPGSTGAPPTRNHRRIPPASFSPTSELPPSSLSSSPARRSCRQPGCLDHRDRLDRYGNGNGTGEAAEGEETLRTQTELPRPDSRSADRLEDLDRDREEDRGRRVVDRPCGDGEGGRGTRAVRRGRRRRRRRRLGGRGCARRKRRRRRKRRSGALRDRERVSPESGRTSAVPSVDALAYTAHYDDADRRGAAETRGAGEKKARERRTNARARRRWKRIGEDHPYESECPYARKDGGWRIRGDNTARCQKPNPRRILSGGEARETGSNGPTRRLRPRIRRYGLLFIFYLLAWPLLCSAGPSEQFAPGFGQNPALENADNLTQRNATLWHHLASEHSFSFSPLSSTVVAHPQPQQQQQQQQQSYVRPGDHGGEAGVNDNLNHHHRRHEEQDAEREAGPRGDRLPAKQDEQREQESLVLRGEEEDDRHRIPETAHPYNEYTWEVNQINPWLSACDLAGPAPADLQGSCGPPEVPKNCPAACAPTSDGNGEPGFHEVVQSLGTRVRGGGGGGGGRTAPEQCLFYLEESHKRDVCRDDFGRSSGSSFLTPRENRYWFTSGLRLRHCCEHAVVNALAPGKAGPLEDVLNGGRKCADALDKLLLVDALAARLHCEFEEVLARYDCAQPYSVIHNCTHCKEAYRKWVCSSLVPYFAHVGPQELDVSDVSKVSRGSGVSKGPGVSGGSRVRPCRSYCQSVEQRCPYLLPGDRAPAYPTQYAGEPTFLCRDPNIPETGEQAGRALHGSAEDECCFHVCSEHGPELGICANCTERKDSKDRKDQRRTSRIRDPPTAPHCDLTPIPPLAAGDEKHDVSETVWSSTSSVPTVSLAVTSESSQQRGGSLCAGRGRSVGSLPVTSSASRVSPQIFLWIISIVSVILSSHSFPAIFLRHVPRTRSRRADGTWGWIGAGSVGRPWRARRRSRTDGGLCRKIGNHFGEVLRKFFRELARKFFGEAFRKFFRELPRRSFRERYQKLRRALFRGSLTKFLGGLLPRELRQGVFKELFFRELFQKFGRDRLLEKEKRCWQWWWPWRCWTPWTTSGYAVNLEVLQDLIQELFQELYVELFQKNYTSLPRHWLLQENFQYLSSRMPGDRESMRKTISGERNAERRWWRWRSWTTSRYVVNLVLLQDLFQEAFQELYEELFQKNYTSLPRHWSLEKNLRYVSPRTSGDVRKDAGNKIGDWWWQWWTICRTSNYAVHRKLFRELFRELFQEIFQELFLRDYTFLPHHHQLFERDIRYYYSARTSTSFRKRVSVDERAKRRWWTPWTASNYVVHRKLFREIFRELFHQIFRELFLGDYTFLPHRHQLFEKNIRYFLPRTSVDGKLRAASREESGSHGKRINGEEAAKCRWWWWHLWIPWTPWIVPNSAIYRRTLRLLYRETLQNNDEDLGRLENRRGQCSRVRLRFTESYASPASFHRSHRANSLRFGRSSPHSDLAHELCRSRPRTLDRGKSDLSSKRRRRGARRTRKRRKTKKGTKRRGRRRKRRKRPGDGCLDGASVRMDPP